MDIKFPLGHDPSLYDLSQVYDVPFHRFDWKDQDLLKRNLDPKVDLTPPSEGYHQAVEDSSPSGVFTGPRSFLKTLGSMAEELPQAVYDAVDYPAAAIRGGGYFSQYPGEAPPDPLSDEGLQRSLDAAGTVTLGGGAIPRAAPKGALRAGLGRSGPTQRYVAALRTPDGQVYAGGPTHGDVMSNMPPEAQKAFWDGYNPKNEGFVDKDGNFLDREQVFEIEYRAGRIDDTLSGQPSMTSEDLDAPNWGGEEVYSSKSKSSGAAPLAMDYESRLARAKEMGFDTEAYHGSLSPDITSFHPNTHSGTRTSANDRLNAEDILDQGTELYGSEGTWGSVYPLRLRGPYIDFPDMEDYWYELGKPLSSFSPRGLKGLAEGNPKLGEILLDPTVDQSMSIKDLLKEKGYRGVSYENVFEDPGSKSYMTFDPKDIRSTAAAFDPAKSDSSDILAANRDRTAGSVPLAMDYESRMARAAKMGFNIDTYHGSVTPDIREFRPGTHSGTAKSAEDRLLSEDVSNRIGRGYFDDAYGYGESVYPLKLRGDYLDVEDLEFVDPNLGWKMVDTPLKELDPDTIKEAFLGFRFTPEDMGKTPREVFKERGYSGLQYENGAEDIGSTSYMTFDPKDIRSTAAAFDPAKSDSSDILAANRSVAAGSVPIFSRMEREAARLQPKATGEQHAATLRNKGVPQEELDWTGVADWLRERGTLPVTKEELLAQIQQRQTQVGVKRFGVDPNHRSQTDDRSYLIGFLDEYTDLDPAEYLNLSTERLRSLAAQKGYDRMFDMTEAPSQVQPTRYSQYQLPGGENYREVLLTLPNENPRIQEIRELVADNTAARHRGEDVPDILQQGHPIREERDRLLREQDQGRFRASHWDEPNVLAHMRVNDRYLNPPNVEEITAKLEAALNAKVGSGPHTNPRNWGSGMAINAVRQGILTPTEAGALARSRGWRNLEEFTDAPGAQGDRVLFAEEIQSDWHQKGRKEGYKNQRIDQRLAEIRKELDAYDHLSPDQIRELRQERDALKEQQTLFGVPDAPFKKSWPDLVLKRLVADAIEGGYDAIAWTDGATQADRYDLSKQISRVTYNPKTQNLKAFDLNGHSVINESGVPPKKLPDYIGKEAAEKLVDEQSLIPGRSLTEIHDDMLRVAEAHYGPEENSRLGIAHMRASPGWRPNGGIWEELYNNSPEFHRLRDEWDKSVRSGSGVHQLSGLDLQVGGEGMKAFYDTELPRRAKKLFGKYGAQVENTTLPDGPQIHTLRITPEMRAAIQKDGLPLFANKSTGVGAAALSGEEKKPITGGRFASGGGVNVEVNGETYQGKRESWRGRPLSKNIDDRRMSQKDNVNSRTKADRLPNALETLIAPSDDLYLTAPHGDEDEFRTDMMIRDGVPKDIEEIILRQGGDQFTSGLIEDDTPGRTDRLPTSMPADSYVIPADIVSGLGQGNTLAGAAILDTMFRTHKTATSKAGGGGTSTKGRVPVIVAGGEYVVPPEVVNSIGQGDATKGHKNLDSFVKRNRLKLVKTLKSLPGPRVD